MVAVEFFVNCGAGAGAERNIFGSATQLETRNLFLSLGMRLC
jgi:hypothetical protein